MGFSDAQITFLQITSTPTQIEDVDDHGEAVADSEMDNLPALYITFLHVSFVWGEKLTVSGPSTDIGAAIDADLYQFDIAGLNGGVQFCVPSGHYLSKLDISLLRPLSSFIHVCFHHTILLRTDSSILAANRITQAGQPASPHHPSPRPRASSTDPGTSSPGSAPRSPEP